MPQPTFSEIKLVTLGVADLDRSIAFYADAFGFEEISRTRVDHETVGELWRIPQGIAGRFAILGIPGIQSGMLRLVEWTPSGDHVWNAPARAHDLGAFGLSFRVTDVAAAWDRIARSGARAKTPPSYWEPHQNIASWTAQSLDPDGTVLDIIQVVGEIESALGPFVAGWDVTEVQSVSVHCSDVRRSESFYSSLGFEPLYDRVVENIELFLGVPKGTKVHNVNLIMPGIRPTGRVDLAHFIELPGRPLKARTLPPARGPLMITLRVTNLEDGARHMLARGAKEIGAGRYTCPPFGDVRAQTLFGPDDEVIEIFEIA